MNGRVVKAILAALALLGPAAVSAEERALVLVAAHDSPIEAVTPDQIRLSYLAVPVEVSRMPLRPLINAADPLLHQVFLQKVIYLSAQHYRRQVMAQVFRSGGVRPVEVDEIDELVDMLQRDPGRISYMWRRDAEQFGQVKTLDVLWQGSVQ